MIHSKQPNCFGRGPLFKHEICRINPMAAGVIWYCCQTHPAIVVKFYYDKFCNIAVGLSSLDWEIDRDMLWQR